MEGSASAAVPCSSSATTGIAGSAEDNVGDSAGEDEQLDSICEQRGSVGDSADEDEQLDSICEQLDFGDDDEVEIDVGVDRGDFELVEATVAKYVSVGFYDSLQEATVALQQHNEFEYTYQTRYTSKNVTGTEFKCRSHATCPSRLKIVERKLGANLVRYELLQKGEHSDASVSRTRHGIAAVHKSEIDSLLELGMGASRVRNLLLHKYRHDPDLVNSVPEVRKIENRKATIKKNLEEGWDIDDFNTIDIWAHSRLCQTREAFDAADESDFAKMNELLVLERFQHHFDDNGKTKASLGLIMTSRVLFRNVAKATTSQRGSLAMSTDGTYRIHCGNWTLVDCGGISVEWETTHHVQRFRPWLYMFVRSECTFAYEQMFGALIKYGRIFLDVDVNLACCSIDHCSAIARALETVWPEVIILSCWEHLLGQARKQRTKLVDKNFYKKYALPQLRWRHETRSLNQFRNLSKCIVRWWKLKGETAYAEWLEDVYLTSRWERWSVNSSPIPGVLPTQQAIESHHKVIKEVITAFEKAPTIHVLNSALPRLLILGSDTLSDGRQGHFCECPLPKDAVSEAKLLLTLPENHREITETGQRDIPVRIVFNSGNAIVRSKNLAGSTVTSTRSKIFVSSLEGSTGRRASVFDIWTKFLSLQHVSVDVERARAMPKFQLRPTWPLSDIEMVRNTLRCTCKSYMHSGWVCSHVIASLELLKKLDLELATEVIQARRPPGRPRAPVGARQQEPASTNFWDPDRLEALLTREPYTPLQWAFITQVDVQKEGQASTFREDRIGTVGGVRLSEEDGVFEWSVAFVHGDVQYYQVDDLVPGLIRAHEQRKV